MSALPESLRRILAKQQPAQVTQPKPFVIPERKGETTTIWRDGEVYRERAGKITQLPSIPAIK